MIDGDAKAFAPLAKAYGIPKDDPERDTVMEEALMGASAVPMEIMRKSARAMELIAAFAKKGSALAVSDAGCGAAMCRAAMQAASFNVLINTKAMKDRTRADALNAEVRSLLAHYVPMADEICRLVEDKLQS